MESNLVAIHYRESEHYPLLKSWWEKRNFPAPNPYFLPPLGIIMHWNEVPMCAGFLFKTDAKIAIINHVVSVPGLPGTEKFKRSQAIDELLNLLTMLAKSSGFKMITAASNVERLNERYQKLGFTKTDSNESHFGRLL